MAETASERGESAGRGCAVWARGRGQKVIEYGEFLSRKRLTVPPSGFDPRGKINPALFDWQRDIVRWGIRKGKAALFEDCGLGKTGQQLTWADHISSHTGMPVLDVAPLAVASQTKGEGDKFGIPV